MAGLRQWNTLRNQIFVGFVLTMVVVLGLAGAVAYDRVSDLLQRSAEKGIQQTAAQANDTLEALLNQIDTSSMQIATDAFVQRLLWKDVSGEGAAFAERQSLQPLLNGYGVYVSGVQSIELFTNEGRRLYPLDDASLAEQVTGDWVREADRASGALVWIGVDPEDSDVVLAIRRVRLMDREFAEGGYLLVRLDRTYFAAGGANSRAMEEPGAMLLVDAARRTVASTLDEAADPYALLDLEGPNITIGEKEYIVVKQTSKTSGWTYALLTPVSAATEGIDVLRTAMLAAGAVGALLFLVLSFFLSTLITRPIFSVIRAMKGARIGKIRPNPQSYATLEVNELNQSYNQMVDNINHLIRVVYEKELLQSSAELAALQAQINPHFLFNTLEAFYWSLEEKGEEELAQHVLDMSGLFRYTIRGRGDDGRVELKKELEHAERYLQLMKLRLGDRLEWRIEAEPACESVVVPKLIVQPLVENAILHGVEGRLGATKVTVRVREAKRPGWIRVEVEDNGPGMDEETLRKLKESLSGGPAAMSARGAGVGLANVERRLALYFGGGAEGDAKRLEIESRLSHGTAVAFEIPKGWGGETA